jgi:hypothetical protein
LNEVGITLPAVAHGNAPTPVISVFRVRRVPAPGKHCHPNGVFWSAHPSDAATIPVRSVRFDSDLSFEAAAGSTISVPKCALPHRSFGSTLAAADPLSVFPVAPVEAHDSPSSELLAREVHGFSHATSIHQCDGHLGMGELN